jgi:hypothetical protein
MIDKSGCDFRIYCAEIDKEDIKYFKQWNHCRPVLLYKTIKLILIVIFMFTKKRFFNVLAISEESPRPSQEKIFRHVLMIFITS